jgi:processive 1,2-diacylglycerol beta-glucosyltransferase
MLLVYGYEPSGHAAAASALEEAGRKAGFVVSRVEIAGDHHPAAGLAVARGYHGLLRACPGAWGALYRSDWARSVMRGVRAAYLNLGGAGRLRAGVRRQAADFVVCPQAAVAAVLSEARRRGDLDVPVVSVLTDYGAHPFWGDPPADLVIAPSTSAAAELASFGVPLDRLRVIGLPIHPAFASPPSRADARSMLALPASAPVVLVSGGSKGLGEVDRTAAAILRESPRAVVLALCGVNDRLRRVLAARRESGTRLRVFGPQPPAMIASMLAAADLHAGKPGGMTSAESLAVGVPLVIARPLPGQEEANARHLLASASAASGGAPVATARRCAALLEDRGHLAMMAANAAAAGHPRAAERIVREIFGFVGGLNPNSSREEFYIPGTRRGDVQPAIDSSD